MIKTKALDDNMERIMNHQVALASARKATERARYKRALQDIAQLAQTPGVSVARAIEIANKALR